MKPVGSLLRDADLISEVELSEALLYQRSQGGRTLEILFSLGTLQQEQLYNFLAKQGIPVINPLNCSVSRAITDLLPREFVQLHDMLPIDRLGRLLTVAMVYPLDRKAIAEAESITGLRIKPMLCRVAELEAAVKRVFGEPTEADAIDDILYEDDLAGTRTDGSVCSLARARTLRRIQSMKRLPMLLETLHWIAPGTSTDDVVWALKRDPAATAMVLRSANAPTTARRRPIANVGLAVERIGTCKVCAELRDGLDSEPYAESTRELAVRYRNFAVPVAETAVKLAQAYGLPNMAGLYEAALLHGIGELAITELDADGYRTLCQRTANADRASAELRAYGATHVEAGSALAEAWGLPDAVMQCIRFHRNPDNAVTAQDAVAIVGIAVEVVRAEQRWEEDCRQALRVLGLDPDTMRSMIYAAHADESARGVEI